MKNEQVTLRMRVKNKKGSLVQRELSSESETEGLFFENIFTIPRHLAFWLTIIYALSVSN